MHPVSIPSSTLSSFTSTPSSTFMNTPHPTSTTTSTLPIPIPIPSLQPQMSDFSSLLDFSFPLNVPLLDTLVTTFYKGFGEPQRQAQFFVTSFQDHPEAWTRAPTILEQSKVMETKYIALQILEKLIQSRWNILPQKEKEGIRNYVTSRIIQLSSLEQLSKPDRQFLAKFNVVLIQIMTSDICPTLNCGCILMKATSTSSSLVCVLCQPPSNNPHPSLRSTTTITSPPPLPSTPTPTPTLTLTEPTLASSLRPTSSATLPSTNGRCFTCHEVLMIDQYTQVVCTTCGDVPSPLSILQTKFHECMHHFQSISPMEDTRLLHSIQSLQSLLTLMERMKKTTPGLSSSTS
ncbi:Karyopherin transporter [Coelomomyces lativittatus]|nr:Karyopherin transporter [Coelomomyces lativittatus]